MKNITISLLMIIISSIAHTQTNITAGNVSGTWTKANSPYIVEGDILVPADKELTIEPGVLIKFNGWYELKVNGQLNALGTAQNNIHFTAVDTTDFYSDGKKGWKGIRMINSSEQDSSELKYCYFDFARVWSEDNSGVVCANDYNYLSVENCTFTNNISDSYYEGSYYGEIIIARYTKALIRNNLIHHNKVSIANFGGNSYLNFTCNKVFNNNGLIGIGTPGKINFTNNTICNNDAGVSITIPIASTDTALFSNNTICNNYSFQLSLSGKIKMFNNNIYEEIGGQSTLPSILISSIIAKVSFYYCNIVVDSIGDGIPIVYENITESDPMFVNPTLGNGVDYDATKADWGLREGSPCINAGISPDSLDLPSTDIKGNPRIYNGIIDIGAIEYNDTITNVVGNKTITSVSIFPNPADNDITIMSNGITNEAEITIVSLLGSTIYKKNTCSTGYLHETINIRSLKCGTYIVNVVSEDAIFSKKLNVL